jgi:DNA-binding GntR family transcriptional regulator
LQSFAEFQSLGMVTLSAGLSAVVHSPNPKEMYEAYEIRAPLEEIAGRAAAKTLKGNTIRLQEELNAMRAAVKHGDLDS